MMEQFGLTAYIVGAILYELIMAIGLVVWLYKDGVRSPQEDEVPAETWTERKKMFTVIVGFWISIGVIILIG